MAELIEVYRNSVPTWESDMMGHMNVQFYVEKATIGLAVLGHHLGLGPDFVRKQNARLVVRDHHIRFLREQRPGAPLSIRAGVLEAFPDHLRIYEEMINPATSEVAATFIAEVELRDLQTRDVRPIPEAAALAADKLRADLPDHGAPRGLERRPPRIGPTLSEAEKCGMVQTYLGEVRPTMVNEDGVLAARAYMGIISDAVPNLLSRMRNEGVSLREMGGAALEYRFVYRQEPKVGDLITMRSAIKDFGEKTYTFCHWIFDLTTGEAVATAEAIAISLDLKARKAMAIPEEIKALLKKEVIRGLQV